jgi:hypothetical protein
LGVRGFLVYDLSGAGALYLHLPVVLTYAAEALETWRH